MPGPAPPPPPSAAQPLPPLALGRLVSHCRFALACHDVDTALAAAATHLSRPPITADGAVPALSLSLSPALPAAGHPLVRLVPVGVQAIGRRGGGGEGGPGSPGPGFTVAVRGSVVVVASPERAVAVVGVGALTRCVCA